MTRIMHVMCTITESPHFTKKQLAKRAARSIRSVLTLIECSARGRSPVVGVRSLQKKNNKTKKTNQQPEEASSRKKERKQPVGFADESWMSAVR